MNGCVLKIIICFFENRKIKRKIPNEIHRSSFKPTFAITTLFLKKEGDLKTKV